MNAIKKVALGLILSLATIAVANASPVNVNIYGGQYLEAAGGGFIFSGSPTSTESWSAINSNILYPGYNWMPFAFFSADITGTISVPTTGTYNFSLSSDDGAYAFIDGVLVGNDGGIHGVQTVTFSDFLTAGNHSVDVQFGNYYCCGSGVQLDLDPGVTFAAPEPAALPMILTGVGLVGGIIRRRKV